MLVLALEASTSSGKAMVFDSEEGIVDSIEERYSSEIDDGMGRTDPEGVNRLLLKLGARIAEGRKIDAIAISAVWHSIVVCDREFKPLTPTYSWNFLGANEICRRIRSDPNLTDELYQRTGCMPHVIYPRHTLQYLEAEGLDYSDKYLLSQGAYIFHQLTGAFAESISTQSGTGLLNIHTLKYDDFALEYFKVNPNQFGELVVYTNTRGLLPSAAKFLGVESGIPVVPAHPDGALNQVGSNANQSDKMTVSVGTSGAIRMVTEKPVLPSGHELWCYYGINKLISGAAISSAGNCINWFFDTLIDHRWDVEDFDELIAEKHDFPIFLPFLFGERCPGWNDDRMASFHNIKPENTIADLYHSIRMGILFNLYQCFEVICTQNREPDEILLSGGITNSVSWTQLLADIFGKPITVTANLHASLLGAAALALYSGQPFAEIDGFYFSGGDKTIVNPRKKSSESFREKYEEYIEYYRKC